MTLIFAVLLGAIQGIAEFLPISSSGHLVVAQQLLGSSFNSSKVPLAYDVLLHVATLLVAIWFLRNDIIMVLVHLWSKKNPEAHQRSWRLAMLVIVATLPAVVVVLLFEKQLEASFESIYVCAIGFIITSIVLSLSDLRMQGRNDEVCEAFSWELPSTLHAFLIGCAQSVAIMPGVSRSGSTIAIALILGMKPEAAVRFSFLMFIPAVVGASIKELPSLAHIPGTELKIYAVGFLTAGLVGLASMRLLSFIVSKSRLKYFALYTAVLGVSLLFI